MKQTLTARHTLHQIAYWAAAAGIVSFAAVQLLPAPKGLCGLLYLLGIFTFDVMMPLMNSISVSYNHRGCKINYGCAIGNFTGGQLLEFFSVPVMLSDGIIMAAGGTAILCLTVDRNAEAVEKVFSTASANLKT